MSSTFSARVFDAMNSSKIVRFSAYAGRVGFGDASHVLGYLHRLVLVQRAEVKHVPVVGNLFDKPRELVLELGIENGVVFEDQNVVRAGIARFADDLHVTQQAAVRARGMRPAGRCFDSVAVDRGKTFDAFEAVTGEFSPGASPAFGASIEIDANDFCEQD